MKLKTLLFGLTLAAGTTLPAAQVVVNNNITWTESQALQSNGAAVPANRSDLNDAFDNDTTTFFSLGWGGSLTGIANFGFMFGQNNGVIEITFNSPNTGYPESAKLVFSNTGGGPTGEVELINLDPSGPADQCTGEVGGITCAFVLNSGNNTWSINLGGNTFDKVVITDTTITRFAGSYNVSKPSDGFDIGELRFDTAVDPSEVPEPGTYAMMGLGMAGLALLRRRK